MERIQSTSPGMKGAIKWPKPVRILKVVPYQITALWNTGEVRINRFDVEGEGWRSNSALAPMADPDTFMKVRVINQAFAWENPPIVVDGVAYVRDFEPERCFKESQLIKPFEPQKAVANLLKQNRLQAGMTQSQLASRTGYSSKYISEIERGMTDIQFGALEYILEVGLGKKLAVVNNDFNLAS